MKMKKRERHHDDLDGDRQKQLAPPRHEQQRSRAGVSEMKRGIADVTRRDEETQQRGDADQVLERGRTSQNSRKRVETDGDAAPQVHLKERSSKPDLLWLPNPAPPNGPLIGLNH